MIFVLFAVLVRSAGWDLPIADAAGTIGLFGYFLMIIISQRFPKCPNCKEPVNMPHESHGSMGLTYGVMVRPERPSRECGFGGQDLTS